LKPNLGFLNKLFILDGMKLFFAIELFTLN